MPTPNEHPAPKRSVLIVEDDDNVAYVMQHVLAETYEVTHAATVGAAKEALQSHVFDAIVLDWRLGSERGKAVLDVLPKNGGVAIPPTIVTSGDTSENEARKQGAAMVLHKPFRLDELRAAVEKLLAGSP